MKQANIMPPSMLDRMVAAVAPRAAVKRMLARQAFDGLPNQNRQAQRPFQNATQADVSGEKINLDCHESTSNHVARRKTEGHGKRRAVDVDVFR